MSATVTQIIPVLPSADMAASLAWWTRICGFTERFTQGSPITYAGLHRGGAILHIGLLVGTVADPELATTIAGQTVTRIMVDDIEAMHTEFLANGGAIHPNGALATKPWGNREFATIDPTGILVWFSQNISAP